MTGATPTTSFIPKLSIQQVVSSSPAFTTASRTPTASAASTASRTPTASVMTSRPILTSTPPRTMASPRNVYRTVKTSRQATSAAPLVGGKISSVSTGSPSTTTPATATSPATSAASLVGGKISAVGTGSPSAATPASATSPAILTFGDSLTHGWTVQGGQPKPYGVYLSQLLGLPSENVVAAGVPGQKASEMAPRLALELARGCHFDGHAAATAASIEEKLLQQYGKDSVRMNQAVKRPWDVVVVLGGTNDVRTGSSSEAVLRDLSVLHQLALRCGAHCVVVTVPPCGEHGRNVAAARQALNKGLRVAARTPTLHLADFDAEMARMMPAQRDALYSGDMLHFNESGYRFLAAVVQKVVQPLIGHTMKRLQPSASFVSVPRPLALPVTSPVRKRLRLANDTSAAVGLEVISAITSSAGRLSAVSAAAISSAVSTYSRQASCKTILAKTIKTISAIMPKTTIKTSRALPTTQQRAILVA